LTEAKPQIEFLLRAVAKASQSLLMLDYDGTLAPFHQNPEEALPYPGISPLLEEIDRVGRTRVVIITGRDANDLIPLLDVEPRPEIWGLHGLQRLKPDGRAELSPLDDRTVAALAAAENWLLYQHLQSMAERKAGSVAVHWRGTNEFEVEAIRGRVLMGWKPLAKYTRLDLLEFDGGVEIRAHHADKGTAVRALLSEMTPGVPAADLGDDFTDEQAFEAVNGRGLSVLVRPRWRMTAAQMWLKPPGEVLNFLQRWLQASQERDALSDNPPIAVKV
jgi:trehalose 6-phosphate phosphatase